MRRSRWVAASVSALLLGTFSNAADAQSRGAEARPSWRPHQARELRNPGMTAAGIVITLTGAILTVAGKAGQFNTLAAAIEAAGLVDALKGEGPFTAEPYRLWSRPQSATKGVTDTRIRARPARPGRMRGSDRAIAPGPRRVRPG